MSEAGAGGKKAKKESTPARKVLLQACQTFLSPLHFPQRLLRDFKKIQRDPPDGINAAPKDNNLFNWQAVIFGSVMPCVFCFVYLVFIIVFAVVPMTRHGREVNVFH